MNSSGKNQIFVIPTGRLGNKMIKMSWAKTLQIKNSDKQVTLNYPSLIEWGIPGTSLFSSKLKFQSAVRKVHKASVIEVSGHKSFYKLSNSRSSSVFLSGGGMHLDNLFPSRQWAKDFFSNEVRFKCCDFSNVEEFAQNYNIAHVRLGDIWSPKGLIRQDYVPLPISFYSDVRRESRRPFAFLVENQDKSSKPYLESLIRNFRGSIILESKCIHRDFWLLRNAIEATTATSTFSWFARWLASPTSSTYLPLMGLFNKSTRPDISLVEGLPREFKKIDVRPIADDFKDWLFS